MATLIRRGGLVVGWWVALVVSAAAASAPGLRIGLDFAEDSAIGLDYLNFFGTPVHVMNPWPMTNSSNRFVTEGALAGMTEAQVQWAVLREVQQRFYAVPTSTGTQLNLDFYLGEVAGPGSVNVALGAYNFDGAGNKWFGQSDFREAFDKPKGGHMAGIALDEIATLNVVFDNPAAVISAIANVTAHEVGHFYGLKHVCADPNCGGCSVGCTVVQDPYDIMATGPSGLPEEGWIERNAFSTVPGTQDGGLSSAAMLINGMGLRRLGDADRDADVDSADLLILISGWTGALEFGEGAADWQQGDFDHDFDVDSSDVLTFLEGWTGAAAERAAWGGELADGIWGGSLVIPPQAAEVLRAFEEHYPAYNGSPFAAVPEPEALRILSLGGTLLAWAAHRNRYFPRR